MRKELLKGVIVGAVSATIVLAATAAFAGTGAGSVFNLGKTNKVNKVSILTGKTTSGMLRVTNTGTGPALQLNVKAGKAPMAVNSAKRVSKLNADYVDGVHASSFMRLHTSVTQVVTNIGAGPALDIQVAAGQPPIAVNSAVKIPNLNADRLDGLSNGSFLRITPSALQTITAYGTGPALSFKVAAGAQPITVNSTTKVDNLNADAVDGISSADLVQGKANVVQGRLAQPHNALSAAVLTVPGYGTLEASTGDAPGSYGLAWRNSLSGTKTDVWISNGGGTTYAALDPNAIANIAPMGSTADAVYTVRVGYAGHLATIVVTPHVDATTGAVYYAQAVYGTF